MAISRVILFVLSFPALVFYSCASPHEIGGVYESSNGNLSFGVQDYSYSGSAISKGDGDIYTKGSWTRVKDTIHLRGNFTAENIHRLDVTTEKWSRDTARINNVTVFQSDTYDPTIFVDVLINDTIRIHLPNANISNGYQWVKLSDSPQMVQMHWNTVQFEAYHREAARFQQQAVRHDRQVIRSHRLDTLYSQKIALEANAYGYLTGHFHIALARDDFDRIELRDTSIVVKSDGKLKWGKEVFRWHLFSNIF
jgi:hypothetical protein